MPKLILSLPNLMAFSQQVCRELLAQSTGAACKHCLRTSTAQTAADLWWQCGLRQLFYLSSSPTPHRILQRRMRNLMHNCRSCGDLLSTDAASAKERDKGTAWHPSQCPAIYNSCLPLLQVHMLAKPVVPA